MVKKHVLISSELHRELLIFKAKVKAKSLEDVISRALFCLGEKLKGDLGDGDSVKSEYSSSSSII